MVREARMLESELVSELARKADAPEATVRAVVAALAELVRQGRVSLDLLTRGEPAPFVPSTPAAAGHRPADPRDSRAVDNLIACARSHPLGVEFLVNGFLGSVAAEFHAHAFTVEAARERLKH